VWNGEYVNASNFNSPNEGQYELQYIVSDTVAVNLVITVNELPNYELPEPKRLALLLNFGSRVVEIYIILCNIGS